MLQEIEKFPLGLWVAESPSVFGYSLVLSLHAIGLAIVLGVNALIALRLLGVGSLPLASLRGFYGFMRVGFALNVVSGLLLFMGGATTMGVMPAFWVKMALVVSGVVIAFRLKSRYLDDAAALSRDIVPPGARQLAWVSLACWSLALVAGRLTGYPEIVAKLLGTRL